MRGREQLFGGFGHAFVLGVDFNLFKVFLEFVQVSVPDLGDSARFARGHTADALAFLFGSRVARASRSALVN